MWVEQHKSGKVNFIERYKNPYTEKWSRVSVLLEKTREAQIGSIGKLKQLIN
jgi:hypothetical protein